MASVLVAGGGGFVGSALVAALVGGEHDVSVMTTSSATTHHPVRVVRLDLWHPEAVADAESAPRYDWVFNLAAYGVDPSQNDPEASRLANAELPLAFADLARRAGASAFVHVGSAFEYAEPIGRRRLSESDPLESRKHYGASKAAGSLAVIEASRKSHLNAVVARLFGVYGAGERPWRLLPSLYASLVSGQSVPLTEGSQVRDFLYVDDAVAGLVSLAKAISDGSQTPCIVNLCSGVEVTVRQFAETVADVLGAPRELLQFGAMPMRPHEIAYLVGDVSRLNRTTPWRPAHSLERGIGMATAELSAKVRSAG
ncbi:MAG: NAD(P)-dependent oxidoreductase [Reyranella sp.]|uniref:NAD-dependent epimerase/dehydratase family protein n=1 Tax=Reyranella sp. TaxID=1929291 RepID=UPI0027322547|nr:NAD(P)-dependent oxidoreductase [Reyranella sp.]MDP1963134.1 NAD(P)-dependent oxidoreductase [Reyranella sp.]MDP2377454.1 NAD(P)-dependent oxidoreductase [Reyranella sp.]